MPHAPTMNLLTLQIKTWVRSSYELPLDRYYFLQHHPLLGMVEELQELADAKTPAERKDAIADTMVYFLDFCGRLEIKPDDDLPTATAPTTPGKLAKTYLKLSQGIRGVTFQDLLQALAGVLLYLRKIAEQEDLDLLLATEEVFRSEVQPRRWARYPLTGHPPTQSLSDTQ